MSLRSPLRRMRYCRSYSGGGGGGGGWSIPQSHPRIFWNATRLSQAQTWWNANNPVTPAYDPAETSNWAMLQATAYAVTGSTSAGMAAVSWAINVQPDDWDNDLNSDQVRWNGEGIALVYDWCYDLFTSSQRTRLIEGDPTPPPSGFWYRGWNMFYSRNWNNSSWGGLAMPANNYFWGNIRNSFLWGVATAYDSTAAQAAVDHCLTSRWPAHLAWAASTGTGAGITDGIGDGGIFAEGSGYGYYHGRYFVAPLLASPQLGRDLLAETNFWRQAGMQLIYATTPAVTGTVHKIHCFGDDQYGQDLFYDKNLSTLLRGLAIAYKEVNIGKYIRAFLKAVTTDPDWDEERWALSADPGGSTLALSTLPLDYYAPGLGFLYARTSWTSTATYLQLQIGANSQGQSGVGHWHADQGNFHLWRDGAFLTQETYGYSDYIPGWNSVGTINVEEAIAHNVVFINGMGPAHAYPLASPASSAVTRLESRTNYLYLAANMTASMRSDGAQYDNPDASTVWREFLFIRPLQTLVIFDRVKAASAGSPKGHAVHYMAQPSVSGSRITGVGSSTSQTLVMDVVTPSSPTIRNIGETLRGKYRIEVESSGVAQNYFLTVLQCRPSTGANLTVSSSETASQVQLDLVHASLGAARVIFPKGENSTGGSFGYDAGGSTPATSTLTTAVMTCTVSDTGVGWS